MSGGSFTGGSRNALWLLAPMAVVGACWLLAPGGVAPIDERAFIESVRMEQADREAHRLASPRAVAQGETAEAVRRRVEDLRSRDGVASPMFVPPTPEPEPDPEPVVGPMPDPAPAPAPATPEFHISSIIAGSTGAICVIDGRPLRAGDEVEAGWIVRSIDVAARLVTVEGPGGCEVELTQGPRPR